MDAGPHHCRCPERQPQENGVFNPRTLGIVKEFSEKIALLPGIKAVRDEDVTSVATMDNITGTSDGMAVDPFMEEPPRSAAALAALQNALFDNAMFVDLGGVARQHRSAHYGPDGIVRGDA